MRLEVSTSTSDVTPEEMEQLARLRHEVRRLPPAVDVTPVPVEVLSPGGCSNGGAQNRADSASPRTSGERADAPNCLDVSRDVVTFHEEPSDAA